MPAKPSPPQEVELKLEVAPSELEKVLAHPLLSERSGRLNDTDPPLDLF